MANNPTRVVLNHLDYVDASCRRKQALSEKAIAFVADIESFIERQIDYIGFGPEFLLANTRKIRKTKIA
jgi:adenylosuccinate synthase